ncbi:carbohydrate ABC transporter permease [Paenibacillus tarimensis]|uniref:carbohydrate ABC transporter permease n=1 Tax=Paenibacillus tarimensis TaxID=416012 RepID=UPI001F1A486B|nr:sugar ABC transporter permease [Paenibacillus tarimensis]MCF2945667.1 sugar ABC transporter permease [Paenibacillus tarimensis]
MDAQHPELKLPAAPAVGQETQTAHKDKLRARRWKEGALGYLFLAPCLVLFAIFLFYPLVKSVYLSFHLTDPRGEVAAFVGLDNYINLAGSGLMWNSLKVTLLFALYTVPAGIVLGLIMAGLTHAKLKGMKIFQFIFSVPLALSVSTASVIWVMLFHPSMGMFNYLLSKLGAGPIQWLTDPSWALISISLMTVWMQSGFNYIVLLSGIQGVPEDIVESAKIDGAGPIRTFVQIVFPLLTPTVFFLSVVSIIHAFQSFGQIHLMTKGGPAGSTEVFVYSIYKEAFINYQFGTGSALALTLFAIIMILTFIQFAVLEKKVHYQ